MKQTRFIPTNDCGLQLREPQEGQQESREIEGRPIVFGVRSVNLTPWSSTRKVYEILEPGCISRELLAKSDVILNLNHSNMVPDVLGRFRNSDKDTLSLELRGDGIDCRCDLPHTNIMYLGQREEEKRTFGANIYDLLNSSFFMDDCIGELAKNRIEMFAQAYQVQIEEWKKADSRGEKREANQNCLSFVKESGETTKYICSIVGDDYMREQMQEMFEELVENYQKIGALS